MATTTEPSQIRKGDTPECWTREKVVGAPFLHFRSGTDRSYWCTKDGFVAVEICKREAVTPPLWYWRIRASRLQFTDESSIREEFTLVSMLDGALTVRQRLGQIAQFPLQV